MKKKVLAICMTALLLTGCGSTAASTSENDTAGKPAASAAKEQETEAATADAAAKEDEEMEYLECAGIDIPRPAGVRFAFTGDNHMTQSHSWHHSTRENVETVVFYYYNGSEPMSGEEVCYGFDWTLEEALSKSLETLDHELKTAYDSFQNDPENFIIDKKEDIDLLGNPGTRGTGTYTLKSGKKINFIFNNVLVMEQSRVWWLVYTESNEQSELDEMLYYADLPLKYAKYYKYGKYGK